MNKIQPLCPVFTFCGGCQYQDIAYEDELQIKENQLREAFQGSLKLSEEVFGTILASPQAYFYRNRLDLKLLKTKMDGVKIGFSPAKGFRVVEVDTCPIARKEIANFIPELKKQAIDKLPSNYRLANLVVRSGEEGKVHWGGIGKRSLTILPENYFWTEILGRRIYYSLDTFFQANLFILPQVINQLRTFNIWHVDSTFYDLYGGVGLFGICVADLVKEVVLIEENPASVRLAEFNKDYNKISYLKIIRGRVEDGFLNISEGQKFSNQILMVDPPRAGLSLFMLQFLNNSSHGNFLLYLSCNPESLVSNCIELTRDRWKFEKIIPMDFFPRTKHLETLVLFSRANS